jgi:hypothetical protein
MAIFLAGARPEAFRVGKITDALPTRHRRGTATVADARKQGEMVHTRSPWPGRATPNDALLEASAARSGLRLVCDCFRNRIMCCVRLESARRNEELGMPRPRERTCSGDRVGRRPDTAACGACAARSTPSWTDPRGSHRNGPVRCVRPLALYEREARAQLSEVR